MPRQLPERISLLVFIALFFTGLTAGAQPYLDGIGVNLLRAVTTNINGSGVRVAVIEAPSDSTNFDYEADPGLVGQPVSLFTFISTNGMATNYPNSIGIFSGHANSAVNVVCSPINTGVATNIAHLDDIEANYFIYNYILVPTEGSITDAVANQSFNWSPPLSMTDQATVDSAYDNYSSQYNTLFVSAVGDGGPVTAPGTSYNSIGVGAYYPSGTSTSIGPTIDNGRCKPDIVAINVLDSFSTPQVTGAAALMMQAARRGDGGSDTNSAFDMRTIKALLLNGAVKPLVWTNSNASPLDARYGSGVLNVLNSYEQLAGGKHSCLVSNLVSLNAVHPPTGAAGTVSSLSGWDYATNTSSASSDAIRHYYFNVSNNLSAVKFTATVTLVWNRHKNKTDINNLNLFFYNCANSNLVNCSTSLVDNVEHIYTTNLAQGRYDLQVWKAGGSTVTTNEIYALAWEFVPPPVLAVSGGGNPALNWPAYPAGFLVQGRTNLLTDSWNTNTLPPLIITNGQNSLPLNPTNTMQFFRLQKPNL